MEKHNPHFVEASKVIEEASLSIKEQLVQEANKLYPKNTPKSDGFVYNADLNMTTYFVVDANANTQAVFVKGK